jgi:hypothetical protein
LEEREMATLLTKDRQTRRSTSPATVEPGPERRGWAAVAIALVAMVAVAATTFALFAGGGDGDVADARRGESEDEALERLVNEGYIPKEALENSSSDADAAGSESLGSVTDQDGSSSTGDGQDSGVPPLDAERATRDNEERLTERFQNEGLIPR